MYQSWKKSATAVTMVLFLVIQCCCYSAAIATGEFKEEVESSTEGIEKIMNETYFNNTNITKSEDRGKFVKILYDLCSFYQSIRDYKEITINDSSKVTKAIKIVLNETYNDSCKWLCDNLGDTNFDCTAINSRNVTELCLTVEAATTANELADELGEVMEPQREDITKS
ncbi:PREDICTED: uncharacterized protein LOC109582577 [Amphimedon queenslandica]|uniref:Uncharacterized protein n=1 Tax=Amphimedon queenslandica TaxID=400682 RepID=A0A1X7UQP8_AMPQE|nr:PREDICTED: uncharacterized protein LOC109582577 [Amphimedon queenslandica]|eukprot:XP_019852896.1 PREDICTED: uncharacterized protein LOC109582577 [Amphimedon queenslandica]